MNAYAIINPTMLQIGDQFDRYQIQAHMAQGGMSDIYKAFDLVNRREVVIKVPDQTMLGDPAQYERFQRELEVMDTLDHPAILKGLGSGKFNRVPFLVTEFVDGKSLRAIIDSSAPIPVDNALNLVRKIADGMAYCHKNEVVHRDLKPENIFISDMEQPVIMDFGLALTKGAHRVTYSNLSATMGTPDYMSPEQVDGKRGDQRTDVYALGTILFEMLTGHPPFTGDSPMVVMSQHLNSLPPRVDNLNAAVPVNIAAIVAKCLQKDPEMRFASMEELITAIDHPETVDVKILSRKPVIEYGGPSLAVLQIWKGIGLSIGVLLALIALALILQSLRH
jgi:eukaryotic-like serine/threonine-protein kinase